MQALWLDAGVARGLGDAAAGLGDSAKGIQARLRRYTTVYCRATVHL